MIQKLKIMLKKIIFSFSLFFKRGEVSQESE